VPRAVAKAPPDHKCKAVVKMCNRLFFSIAPLEIILTEASTSYK